MNFAFHPEAEEEFNEAIEYYEEIEPGIGYDFALGACPRIGAAARGRHFESDISCI